MPSIQFRFIQIAHDTSQLCATDLVGLSSFCALVPFLIKCLQLRAIYRSAERMKANQINGESSNAINYLLFVVRNLEKLGKHLTCAPDIWHVACASMCAWSVPKPNKYGRLCHGLAGSLGPSAEWQAFQFIHSLVWFFFIFFFFIEHLEQHFIIKCIFLLTNKLTIEFDSIGSN